ncbi:MAG: hypothetical protein HUU35_08245, partial [Armatimonadetes bacterium]|nr:hypothetical protein [Armatimonadota bacterium]
ALGADRAVTVSDASFSLHARREAVNWSTDTFAESLGARLTAARVGPLETGVTVSQISLFEANAEGQQEFRKGHVLAADLRLRLGDQSVWLEYLSSMGEEVSRRLDEEAGRAFQATFVKQFGDHLKLDLGYRRLSAGFVPFDSLLTGLEAPDLYGVQAGVAYRSSRFDIRSSGSVYRPEGQPVGYANQFGATMGYRWTDRWRVTLGYQGVNRRRLANLDDMWRNSFTGGISYGSSARLRADLSYRYDTSDVEQEPAGHTIGASLGLGF